MYVLRCIKNGYYTEDLEAVLSHWIHTIILILGERLLAIKLNLIYDVILDHTQIFLISEEYKNVVETIAKPRAVPASAGASTSATAKSKNSSN